MFDQVTLRLNADPLILSALREDITSEDIKEVIRLIKNLDNNNTILNNKQFTQYLLEGIKVPSQEDGATRYKTIKVIDFNNIEINTFKAINQYTIIEESEKRPDIIVFINGMPLVVIELKSTTSATRMLIASKISSSHDGIEIIKKITAESR